MTESFYIYETQTPAQKLVEHLDANAKEYYAPIIEKGDAGMNETNEEFLERMKRKAYTKMVFLAVQVEMPDLKRLIEQAERVQELENDIEVMSMAAGDSANELVNSRLVNKLLKAERAGFKAENERLREKEDAQAELYRRLNASYVEICKENERLGEKHAGLIKNYNELFIQENAMQAHYQLAFKSMQMYKKCCDDITLAMNTERPAEEKTKDVRRILEGLK